MFDHVKFGVSDYAASKAFYMKALAPLGVTEVTELSRFTNPTATLRCACSRRTRNPRTFIWPSWLRIASKCKPFIARRWRRAARTTAHRVCARNTTETTMPRS